MSEESFLERMRAKPQHVKGRYAFLGALLITIVIGAVWVTSLPARFSSISEVEPVNNDASSASSQLKELGEFFKTTKDQLGSVVDGAERDGETVDTETITEDRAEEEETPVPVETDEKIPEPRTVLIGTTSSQKSQQSGE